MDTQRLAGRVALVTRTSGGLGRAIGLRLATEGAAVAVASRSEQLEDPTLDDLLEGAVVKNLLKLGALEPAEVSRTVVYLGSDDNCCVTDGKIVVDAGTRLP